MVYLVGGLALIALAGYLASLFMRGDIRTLVRFLRYGAGWGAIATAVVMFLGGRVGLGSMLGLAGASILSRGRLGPIDFGAGMTGVDNSSKVKSRHLEMTLDHDTGEISGVVRDGEFARADLADLDPDQSWTLYRAVEGDPDSLALYRTWLDAHRQGWDAYFAEHYGFEGEAGGAGPEDHAQTGSPGRDPLAEAYDILGLGPDASAQDVRAAHRQLMKKVHPDHGGSSYLAARINEAKDRLLEAIARKPL